MTRAALVREDRDKALEREKKGWGISSKGPYVQLAQRIVRRNVAMEK
jgi:hypothetical protein